MWHYEADHSIFPECETIGSITSPDPSQTTSRCGFCKPHELVLITTTFEDLSPPTLKLLLGAVGVDVQADWYNVGLELGLEPSALESIKKGYSHDLSSCMTRVFIVWHESQSSEYSWKKLAEVLCSREVNKPYLLPKML